MTVITDAEISSVALASSVSFPAGMVVNAFTSVIQDEGNYTGDGTKISVVLGTTSGTSALTSASNDLLIFVNGEARKANTSTGDYQILYLCGGSLGSTTSGQRIGRYGQGDGDNSRRTISWSAKDATPGSVTPTYSIYADLNATQAFLIDSLVMTFIEIKG